MTTQPPPFEPCPYEPTAYDSFDHRTRRLDFGPLRYYATTPCNGRGDRLGRLRTLHIGPWRFSVRRSRPGDRR